MRFVSCVDHADAVPRIKIARCLVVNIGKVTQRFAGVRRRRFSRCSPRPLDEARGSVHLQRGDGISPQCVGGRGGDEPGLRPRDFHFGGAEDRVAQLGEVIAQTCLGAVRALCRVMRQGDGRRSTGTRFVGDLQREAVGGLGEAQAHVDASLGGLARQRQLPGVIAIAAQRDAGFQSRSLKLANWLIGGDSPDFAHLPRDIHLRAFHLALVHPGDAVAVGQRVMCVHLEPLRRHPSHGAERQPDVNGGIEGADVRLASGRKVVGALAVEGLVGIRREGVAAATM